MGQTATRATRITLIALFFSWGVVAVLLRLAVPYFKTVFDLGFRDALLIQSAFFITYLFLARASGGVIARVGFRHGAALGLGLMATGAFALALVAGARQFAALLPAVFVIACGVTFLQVAANPLAAIHAGPRSGAANLTFAQAFNSLGTVVAPMIAAATFMGATAAPTAHMLTSLQETFAAVGVLLVGLALFALRVFPAMPRDAVVVAGRIPDSHRLRVAAGFAAIFAYVGGEVAITATLVNLLEHIPALDLQRGESTRLTALFWVGMLLGRLAGAYLLASVPRGAALAVSAGTSAIMVLAGWLLDGTAAAAALLSLGLLNAILFPTVFAIATQDLSEPQRARASGWLCTGIAGGALVPLLFGQVADLIGIRAALVVPALCYLVVAAFGLFYGDARTGLSRPAPQPE